MSAFINENTQFVDSDGKPIVNGKLYIGVKGLDPVNNAITIYSDRSLSTVIANPQILDANGRSANKIWIPGLYSFRVDNTNDVQQIQDLDAGDISVTGTTSLFNVQGTNSITATASPTIASYVDGEVYIFRSANANTGSTTLNIDNVGSKDVTIAGQVISAGDIREDVTYAVAYNEVTDDFDLLGASSQGATGGGSDRVFYENSQTVTTDYTITSGQNAMTAGPITINDSITVTIPDGSTWSIV